MVAALSGAALLGASAATRFGVFHAGMASARDPKYTVVPQRQRLDERGAAKVEPGFVHAATYTAGASRLTRTRPRRLPPARTDRAPERPPISF